LDGKRQRTALKDRNVVNRLKRSVFYCYFCKGINHKKRFCRIRKRYLQKTTTVNVNFNPKLSNLQVNGSIFNKSQNILIDTGSAISLINSDALPKNCKPCKDTSLRLKSANGGYLWILGTIMIECKLDNFVFNVKFWVVKNFECQILLGMDFLKFHNADIDFMSQTLKLSNNSVTAHIPFADKQHCYNFDFDERNCVRVSTRTLLLPCATTRVQVLLNKPRKFPEYFQPNQHFHADLGVFVHGRINFEECFIFVTNFSNVPFTIFENSKVGQLEPLIMVKCDDDDVSAVHVNIVNGMRNWNVGENLSKIQKESIVKLLNSYTNVFAESISEIEPIKEVGELTIDTGDAKPIHLPPYRTSHREKEIIREQINDMLDAGVIRESFSSWSSPVVLVKKKDGNWRFCTDFKRLNHVIRKDSYPLPVIDDIMSYLNGAVLFSSIDVLSAYWQIPIAEKDREKTAFITSEGLYEYNVVPFGLTSSPACFQRCMDKILSGLKWKSCIVYLDDVLIKGDSFEDHYNNLKLVLDRFNQVGMKLKADKCHFAQSEISILGYVANANGLSPDPNKIRAVNDFPTPRNVKSVQSFLGLTNYYRKFIEGFANIARPLNLLTRKNVPFTWGPEEEKSFEDLKQALCNAPVLRHFDNGLPVEIHTDASNFGLGCILMQRENNNLKPVAYASRRLSDAETRYNTTEKECLAIVYALKYFRHYIWGRRFKIVTDHHALCYLFKSRDPSSRLTRWILLLGEFDFEIQHKNGKNHQGPDCLSRHPVFPAECDLDTIPVFAIETENTNNVQRNDPELRLLIECFERPNEADPKLIKKSRSFVLENGRLYKKNFSPNGKSKLLVIPQQQRSEILTACHDDPLSGGHLGIAKTIGKIKARYFWENMNREIEQYVKSCVHCQHRKKPPTRPSGLLDPIKVGEPFERIGYDLLGPFPKSENGNTYIIVCMEYATKWAEAKAIPNGTAKEVAKFLIEEIVCRHGCPKEILSDRGKCFTSKVITALIEGLGSYPRRTTSYHPQTNGLTEHFNGTLATMLSMYVSTNQKDWCVYVPLVCFAYNTSVQETTKETPFYLLYGRRAKLPLDVALNDEYEEEEVRNYLQKIKDARELARKNIEKSQVKQKERYDEKHKPVEYKEGSKVLVFSPIRKIGRSEKLLHRWQGPYLVEKKVSDVNYLLKIKKGKEYSFDTVHVDRMKQFYERSRNIE